MMNNELKYFLYARKSSESEDRQMASIGDQIKEIQNLASELNLEIVEIFEESGSAKAPGRKLFNEMLLRIEQGEANGILCWKLNRLARNPVDGGQISWMLQKNLIKHIQCYGRDYKPNDNVLMMQVEFGMANQFVKDLSVDVKRGTRNKAERGWFPASLLPIGYMHNKDRTGKVKKKEIIPDPKIFPILKELWKLMLTKAYSIAEIKREADRLGLRNNKKRCYVHNSFIRMFCNPFYYGKFKWKDGNDNYQLFKGKHKPLITQTEFNRIQRILGTIGNNNHERKYNYTFKGLLSCGECSGAITASRKRNVYCKGCKRKFSCMHRADCPRCKVPISKMKNPKIVDVLYYHCTKKKGPCSQKYMSSAKLNLLYVEAIKDMQLSESVYQFMLVELQTLEQVTESESRQIYQVLKKQQSELKNRIQSLALMRADGEISKDDFQKMKNVTEKEIKEKADQIHDLDYQDIHWAQLAKSYLDLCRHAKSILANGDQKEVKSYSTTLA